jgi:hypothetical protein
MVVCQHQSGGVPIRLLTGHSFIDKRGKGIGKGSTSGYRRVSNNNVAVCGHTFECVFSFLKSSSFDLITYDPGSDTNVSAGDCSGGSPTTCSACGIEL